MGHSHSTDYPPYMREAQLLDVTLFMQKELEASFIRTFYFQHEMQLMAMLWSSMLCVMYALSKRVIVDSY